MGKGWWFGPTRGRRIWRWRRFKVVKETLPTSHVSCNDIAFLPRFLISCSAKSFFPAFCHYVFQKRIFETILYSKFVNARHLSRLFLQPGTNFEFPNESEYSLSNFIRVIPSVFIMPSLQI